MKCEQRKGHEQKFLYNDRNNMSMEKLSHELQRQIKIENPLEMSSDFGDEFVDRMTSADFCHDKEAHIESINDAVRNNVFISHFRNAIIENQHLFRGRVVLNLRCGIGILALFVAKAKAAKVYAVDESNVLDYTRRIVKDNGLQNTIEVFQSNIRNLTLPVLEVDIIICNWMGFALLHQSACLEVLYARDKWLKKPGGLILPNRAQILIAPIEDSRHKCRKIDWWNNVYNFNMKCIRNHVIKGPHNLSLKRKQVILAFYTYCFYVSFKYFHILFKFVCLVSER